MRGDCGARLEVANIETCLGSSTFALIFCDDCDDAGRLHAKDKLYVSDGARRDAVDNCGCEGDGDSHGNGSYHEPVAAVPTKKEEPSHG